jgi:hypothetical protein
MNIGARKYLSRTAFWARDRELVGQPVVPFERDDAAADLAGYRQSWPSVKLVGGAGHRIPDR